jgi:hypothetical protein
MRALFETLADTRGLVIDCVMPELQFRFDAHRGDSRNAELAFVGHTANARWAVTVEAKADEPFGATVAETAADALERSIENSRSKGLQRGGDLVGALFHPRTNGAPQMGSLRYQLLTVAAGSLAFAVREQASSAILIVHEFVTDKTNDARHIKNGAD